MDGCCETPMAEHVANFWRLLSEGKVRILVETRCDHSFGGLGHWNSSSFPDDVAKAIAIDRWQMLGALGYPVPGDVREGSYRCGLCDARNAADSDLLEALKGVVAVSDRKTVEYDRAHAAIAKAEGA